MQIFFILSSEETEVFFDLLTFIMPLLIKLRKKYILSQPVYLNRYCSTWWVITRRVTTGRDPQRSEAAKHQQQLHINPSQRPFPFLSRPKMHEMNLLLRVKNQGAAQTWQNFWWTSFKVQNLDGLVIIIHPPENAARLKESQQKLFPHQGRSSPDQDPTANNKICRNQWRNNGPVREGGAGAASHRLVGAAVLTAAN